MTHEKTPCPEYYVFTGGTSIKIRLILTRENKIRQGIKSGLGDPVMELGIATFKFCKRSIRIHQ